MQAFKSLVEFQKHFNTEEKCREYLEIQRWGGTVACPYCGCAKVYRYKDGKRYNCAEPTCKRVFSVTVGTIYENTKLPLVKWFLATYLLAVHSKGISSMQLSKFLGITQKSAWHMAHRIREGFIDAPEQLKGTVEIDETYVGGSDKNRHEHKKKGKGGKAAVLGAVERGGRLTAKVLADNSNESIKEAVKDIVAPESTIMTDEHRAYNNLGYTHETIKHNQKEFARGNVHTNRIEGYWSLLKRQIDGIHHFVTSKHLQRYCNESSFRYNRRETTQDVRFASVLANCEGQLRYQDLIQ